MDETARPLTGHGENRCAVLPYRVEVDTRAGADEGDGMAPAPLDPAAAPALSPEAAAAAVEPRLGFLLRLGSALHESGVPAHRLEELMSRIAARYELEVRTFSAPTSLFVSWGPPEAARTAFVRVQPGMFDLGRLSEIDALTGEVIAGTVTPDDAQERLEAIRRRPAHYGPVLTTLAYCLASATGARLFSGGLYEVVAAGLIGLITGLLASASAPVPALGRVLEGLAAAIAAFLVTLAMRLHPLSGEITLIAGLFVFLPGLTFTTGLAELATQNLLSGTARLAGAFVTLFQLLFGVAMGTKAAGLLDKAPLPTLGTLAVPLPTWTVGVALALGAMALLILFRARRRDAPVVLAAAVVAYFSGRFGATLLGPQLGAFAGALAVGVGSNLFARFADRPAVLTQVPGLMMLVPGSLGFRSLDSLLDGDVLTGVERAFAMGFTGIALVAGLLIANVLVEPRRAL